MFTRLPTPIKIALAAVGAIIVLAGIGYYALGSYANSQNASAEPPLSATGSVPAHSAPGVTGEWSSAKGSKAGYRVDEVLNGDDVMVVGRTKHVRARATATENAVKSATMSVDLASVTTDSKTRDAYFRSGVVDVSKHPRASFTLTEPLSVGPLAHRTGHISVTAHGTMQLNGTKNAVATKLTITRRENRITVTGSVPITWTDYGVTPPDLGFVQVSDTGRIEFKTIFTKSS